MKNFMYENIGICMFVLNRYRLLIVGFVVARFNCKLLANQIAFTKYNV
jgi:hypothetical protein